MKIVSKFKNLPPETKVAFNVGMMQGFFWFAWAFTSYATVYLQELGFTASEVGQINAVCNAVVIFSMMFFGMLSDKINSIKKVLLITLTIGVALYASIPLLPTGTEYVFFIFLLFYPFVNVFRGVTPTLLENITIRTCAVKGVHYGVVRSFGSVLFTIGSLLSVWSLNFFEVKDSFFMYGILALPALFFIFTSFDPKFVRQEKSKKVSLVPLLKNYYFMSFLFVILIAQFAMIGEGAFLPYLLESVGISGSQFPTLLAVRALAEVPFLLIVVNLRKRFKLKFLLMIAFVLMGLEAVLIGMFAGELSVTIAVTSIYGLGNGLFLGTIGFYLFKLAPEELKASAQSMYASVTAIAGIGGNMLGGILFDALGGRTYYAIIGCTFIAALLIFAMTLFLKRKTPNPADEKN